jgi:hypothetical protein
VFAVVVGINDYSTHTDLSYAVADARDVNLALDRFGVPGANRMVLTDRQATRSRLAQALEWLVRSAGPEDTAVVFYAGHVGKASSTTEALVLADGQAMTDAELAYALRPLAASRAWIVIAGCYGGGFTEVLAPGRILTAAAGANAQAYENTALGRSYLVEYMVHRAWLEGRADATVEAAFVWAVDELRREHPDRVPVQIDHAVGSLRLGG